MSLQIGFQYKYRPEYWAVRLQVALLEEELKHSLVHDLCPPPPRAAFGGIMTDGREQC